jgi:hypothetical protein
VTNLAFRVTDVRVEPHAAVPTLLFLLVVEEVAGDVVESIALRCQIRIEPQRRRYTRVEEERLLELFGETPRWGDTLRPFLWTHVSTIVPGFAGATAIELPVPVSYDLEVAASKYFHALFLFSGTLFIRGPDGLRVQQVPWDREASFRLPVRVWRGLMDTYFPGSGWLRLRRDTLDGLQRIKVRRALATWDDVVVALLKEAGEPPGEVP